MFVTPAYAQATGATPDVFISILPFVLIFVIMYFLIIRPQRTQLKKRGEMLNAIRRGDTVVTGGGFVGKVTKVIDDNELDRHPEIEALRDVSSEAPSEVDARNANLTFIKLDGDVGCVVNGAGLAMATMDLVKYYGGEPANFLDIGGSSNPEKVVNALRIITADTNVKCILFNIFGGITRTDDVANGIVTATRANPLTVPIVIRLTGTNEEIAMKILTDNGFTASKDMDEAVQKAVAMAKGGKAA